MQHTNFMNCSMYDKPSDDLMHPKFRAMIKTHPKFRYKIKVVGGEYFYEEMSYEETCQKAFIFPESEDKVLKN